MSLIAKKYNIPETTVKAMVKDGWLSCSVIRYEEVMYIYNTALKDTGVSSRAIQKAADSTGYSESMVYHIVSKFK